VPAPDIFAVALRPQKGSILGGMTRQGGNVEDSFIAEGAVTYASTAAVAFASIDPTPDYVQLSVQESRGGDNRV